jgi:hypothetical protein
MSNPSETYLLLQQRVEQDLAPLTQRGYRILGSECSDSPTGANITLARERAWVSISFDIRDRVGSLYVGKLSGQHPLLPNYNILTYLVQLCGFRGRINQGLSPQQRDSMGIEQLMFNDIGVLASALLQFAPRIVDDTEDFERNAPG